MIDSNLQNIQQKAITNGNWEPLREYYLPEKIKFILVGEAPPAGGERFFYYDDVPRYDYLFLNTMSALFPMETYEYDRIKTPERKRALLNMFKEKGGYLMDLYSAPKAQLPKPCNKKACILDFRQRLQKIETRLDDNVSFILVHSAAACLAKHLYTYTPDAKVIQLPFPLYGKQEHFKQTLKEYINNLSSNGQTQNAKP